MKPRIAPQHYFPLKVYVRWARISLSQKPKVRPIESSPPHTGQTYAGNVRVVHTPGNVLAPRKSGQQFLPLNRGVRWADMGGLFVHRPNGHIRSMTKTAGCTFSVQTCANMYQSKGYVPNVPPITPTRLHCPLKHKVFIIESRPFFLGNYLAHIGNSIIGPNETMRDP